MQRIPATIITGFLGSGKTSLLRHVLEQSQGKRIALLINEFGDMGVDGELLASCDSASCRKEDIIELANGCICCTVAEDFLPAMQKILAQEPNVDHIIIETSGLALPKPLVKAFTWPDVRTRTTVDGVITVLDAAALAQGRVADSLAALEQQREQDEELDHDNPIEELFEEQLLCADMVVLNKMDLVEDRNQEQLLAKLRPMIRQGVPIIESRNAQVDPAILLGLDAQAEDDLDARPSHHDDGHEHDHQDFVSIVVDLPQLSDPAPLLEAVAKIYTLTELYRVKGFVAIKDKGMRMVIQAAGPRVEASFDRQWREAELQSTRLVVIGDHDFDQDLVRKTLLQAAKSGA